MDTKYHRGDVVIVHYPPEKPKKAVIAHVQLHHDCEHSYWLEGGGTLWESQIAGSLWEAQQLEVMLYNADEIEERQV